MSSATAFSSSKLGVLGVQLAVSNLTNLHLHLVSDDLLSNHPSHHIGLEHIRVIPLICNSFDDYLSKRFDLSPDTVESDSIISHFNEIAWRLSRSDSNISESDVWTDDIPVLAHYQSFCTQNFISAPSVSKLQHLDLAMLACWFSSVENLCQFFDRNVWTETIILGLLSILGERNNDPKCLSIAVAILAFIVENHALKASVLTEANISQLLRLTLSKAIYPAKDTPIPIEWEIGFCRMGIRRLLDIAVVKASPTAVEECLAFVKKWWSRLRGAALGTSEGFETPSKYRPNDVDAPAPVTRSALEVLSDMYERSEPVRNSVWQMVEADVAADVQRFPFPFDPKRDIDVSRSGSPSRGGASLISTSAAGEGRGLAFLNSYACSLCPRTLVVGCRFLCAVIQNNLLSAASISTASSSSFSSSSSTTNGPLSALPRAPGLSQAPGHAHSTWLKYGINLVYRCVLSRMNQFFDIGPNGALFSNSSSSSASSSSSSVNASSPRRNGRHSSGPSDTSPASFLATHRCVMEPVAIALSRLCWICLCADLDGCYLAGLQDSMGDSSVFSKRVQDEVQTIVGMLHFLCDSHEDLRSTLSDQDDATTEGEGPDYGLRYADPKVRYSLLEQLEDAIVHCMRSLAWIATTLEALHESESEGGESSPRDALGMPYSRSKGSRSQGSRLGGRASASASTAAAAAEVTCSPMLNYALEAIVTLLRSDVLGTLLHQLLTKAGVWTGVGEGHATRTGGGVMEDRPLLSASSLRLPVELHRRSDDQVRDIMQRGQQQAALGAGLADKQKDVSSGRGMHAEGVGRKPLSGVVSGPASVAGASTGGSTSGASVDGAVGRSRIASSRPRLIVDEEEDDDGDSEMMLGVGASSGARYGRGRQEKHGQRGGTGVGEEDDDTYGAGPPSALSSSSASNNTEAAAAAVVVVTAAGSDGVSFGGGAIDVLSSRRKQPRPTPTQPVTTTAKPVNHTQRSTTGAAAVDTSMSSSRVSTSRTRSRLALDDSEDLLDDAVPSSDVLQTTKDGISGVTGNQAQRRGAGSNQIASVMDVPSTHGSNDSSIVGRNRRASLRAGSIRGGVSEYTPGISAGTVGDSTEMDEPEGDGVNMSISSPPLRKFCADANSNDDMDTDYHDHVNGAAGRLRNFDNDGDDQCEGDAIHIEEPMTGADFAFGGLSLGPAASVATARLNSTSGLTTGGSNVRTGTGIGTGENKSRDSGLHSNRQIAAAEEERKSGRGHLPDHGAATTGRAGTERGTGAGSRAKAGDSSAADAVAGDLSRNGNGLSWEQEDALDASNLFSLTSAAGTFTNPRTTVGNQRAAQQSGTTLQPGDLVASRSHQARTASATVTSLKHNHVKAERSQTVSGSAAQAQMALGATRQSGNGDGDGNGNGDGDGDGVGDLDSNDDQQKGRMEEAAGSSDFDEDLDEKHHQLTSPAGQRLTLSMFSSDDIDNDASRTHGSRSDNVVTSSHSLEQRRAADTSTTAKRNDIGSSHGGRYGYRGGDDRHRDGDGDGDEHETGNENGPLRDTGSRNRSQATDRPSSSFESPTTSLGADNIAPDGNFYGLLHAMANLRADIVQLRTRVIAAEQLVSLRDEEIASLKADNDDLTQANQSVEENVSALRVEAGSLRARALASASGYEELSGQVMDMEGELATSRALCTELEEKVASQEQVIQESWRKLAQMAQLEARTQAEHQSLVQRAKDHEEAAHRANLALQTTRANCQAAVSEVDLQKKQLAQLRTQESAQGRVLTDTQAQLRAALSEIAALKKQRDSVQQGLDVEVKQTHALLEENEAKERTISEQAVSIEELSEEASQLRISNEQLRRSLHEEQQHSHELDIRLADQEAEMVRLRQEWSRQKEKFKEQEKLLLAELDSRKQKEEKLSDELRRHREIISFINKLSGENDSAGGDAAEGLAAASTMKQTIRRLSHAASELRQDP